MGNHRRGAAGSLLPLMAGVLAATGCASAYPELQQDISQAVAAAQPTAQDSAAARVSTAAGAGAGSQLPAGAATTGSTGTAGAAGTGGVAGSTTAQTPMTTTPATPASTGASTPQTSMPGQAMPGQAMPGQSMPAAPAAPTYAMPMSAGTNGVRVTTVANLPSPEAVVLVTAGGLLLVAGSEPTATGARGVIMRMDMNGTVRDARWIVGGAKTAILRNPRGMAIVGDTLWVTDGTVLRAFARRTGAPIATIPMGTSLGAVSLSDVAVGGDGALYVADAAVTYTARGVAQQKGSGKIFRVSGRKAEVALEHARLVQPTALSWDPITTRLLIASATSDTIMGWRPGSSGPETVAVAPGPWTGVTALGGMVFFALNSARGEVHQFQNGMVRRVVEGARGAGDMAFDPARFRVVVPIPGESRVEIWEVRR